MKKNMIVILVFVLFGCAGHRSAKLNVNENGAIAHEDRNVSLIQPSINPVELATSRAIVLNAESQAGLMKALAKQIESNKTATTESEMYVGMFPNLDPTESVYIPHPELSQRIEVLPGSFAVIFTHQIPDRILVFNKKGRYTKHAPYKKPGVYNGIKYDYYLKIYDAR